MQLGATDFNLQDFLNWGKLPDSIIQQQKALEKSRAIEAGVFTATMPLPTGIKPGDQMQNTSDLNIKFDFTQPGLPGLIDTTSPVIPDFLKSATTLNTTIAKPSAGAIALSMQQQPWYKNKNTLLMVGGVAITLAALFVFTGNKPK